MQGQLLPLKINQLKAVHFTLAEQLFLFWLFWEEYRFSCVGGTEFYGVPKRGQRCVGYWSGWYF